jgi:MerR family transcriptional regulator, copper efflux regulator
MRIGELAVRAGVNIQTLRFYEREKLLGAPVRTSSGYRSYQERDLERVRFIRLCQGLGFTLREIHQLLELHKSLTEYKGLGVMKPAAVKKIVEMANERLTVIDEKLGVLRTMRGELTSLVETLTSDAPAVCPVSRS